MRSPLAIALVFTVLLAGWLASRPLQELLAGDGGATPVPVTTASDTAPPRMTVLVEPSVAQPIAPELVVSGYSAPIRSVRLRVETEGAVVATPVEEGRAVEAGTVLARLDLRNRESRVREARALMAQRELEFEAARRLEAKQFQSETRVAETRTQLEIARNALHEAELDLARIEVRAPFAGVLEQRMVEVGDYVDVGDEVALVIEQDPLLIVGNAPESMVGRLAQGEPGFARLADGSVVEGRLRYVARQADPSTRTYRIELEVPNLKGRLAAGMSARLVVQEPPVAAHRVSAAALVLADDGTVGIKAVDDAGIVRFHPAHIVRPGTDAVWLGGLPDRLRVIVTGQGFVAAGEAVEVEMAAPEGDEPS